MLDGAVKLMSTDAISGMTRFLSNAAVSRTSGLAASSTVNDWVDLDAFLVDLAGERLFNPDYAGIDDTHRRVMVTYVGFGDPRAQFVAAIETNFDHVLRLPITVPTWQLHAAAATAFLAEDQPTAVKLCELRSTFYQEMSRRYVDSLKTVLLDMGRRPGPGFDETLITSLIHTFFNGAVLRHLIDQTAFPDGGRTVGRAALAMLLGSTEPDEPTAPAGDPRATVRMATARAALELLRRGTGPEHPDTPDDLRRLLGADLDLDNATVVSMFGSEFSSLANVWDTALRHILEARVEHVWRLHASHPGVVLVKIASNLVQLHREHPGLLAACATTIGAASSPYLSRVERKIRQLLSDIHVPDPDDTSRRLFTSCLNGDSETAQGLLRATVAELRDEVR